MNRATWKNNTRTVTGWWSYNWSADRFHIVLHSQDRITRRQKQIVVAGETPEWGNWRLDSSACLMGEDVVEGPNTKEQ